MTHLISNTELMEDLKPWLIDRERLNISVILGMGQFGKVFKGSVQFNDGRHHVIAAKTIKGITD